MNNLSQPILQPGTIEWFANNGKVFLFENGIMLPFEEASINALNLLRKDLEKHPGAVVALEIIGISDPMEQLKQYAMCMYGELNNAPDFYGHRKNAEDEEFVQLHCSTKCCRYRAMLCNPIHIYDLRLSDREIDVLRLKAQMKTPEEIASSLNICLNTVRVHIQKLLQKFGFKSSEQLTAWASHHIV